MKRMIQRVAALIVGLGLGFGALAGLETVTHISDLNSSWPLGSDLASTSDDHIRNIKVALKTDFPNITGPVTVTQAQINAAANLATSLTWTGNDIFRTSSAAGTEGLKIDNSAGDARFGFYSAGTEYGLLQATTNAFGIAAIGASTNLNLQVNNGIALQIIPAGNATINAPSSGSALTTNSGAAATQSIDIKGSAGATAASYVKFTAQNGAAVGFLGVAGSAQTLSTGASAGDFVMRADNGGIDLSGNGGSSVGLKVTTGNAVQGLGPTAAALVDMTPDTSTFTATYTGMNSATTCTATWTRVGKLVTLFFCAATGTSNVNTFTMTGLPSAIQPSTLTQHVSIGTSAVTNGGSVTTFPVSASFAPSSGTVTFYLSGSSTGWLATSTGKGFNAGASVSYLLN